ncbi:hypothetical protein ACSSS7_007698 [Eimeria intestinalis]
MEAKLLLNSVVLDSAPALEFQAQDPVPRQWVQREQWTWTRLGSRAEPPAGIVLTPPAQGPTGGGPLSGRQPEPKEGVRPQLLRAGTHTQQLHPYELRDVLLEGHMGGTEISTNVAVHHQVLNDILSQPEISSEVLFAVGHPMEGETGGGGRVRQSWRTVEKQKRSREQRPVRKPEDSGVPGCQPRQRPLGLEPLGSQPWARVRREFPPLFRASLVLPRIESVAAMTRRGLSLSKTSVSCCEVSFQRLARCVRGGGATKLHYSVTRPLQEGAAQRGVRVASGNFAEYILERLSPYPKYPYRRQN